VGRYIFYSRRRGYTNFGGKRASRELSTIPTVFFGAPNMGRHNNTPGFVGAITKPLRRETPLFISRKKSGPLTILKGAGNKFSQTERR